MFELFEVLICLFEVFLLHILVSGLLSYRSRKRGFLLLGYVTLFVVLLPVSLFPLSPLLRITLITAVACIFLYIVCNSRFLPCFSVALLYSVVAVVSEFLGMGVLYLFGMQNIDLLHNGGARIVYMALAKVIHLCAVLLISSLSRHGAMNIPFRKIMPLLLCQVFSIFLCNFLLQTASTLPFSSDPPVSLAVALIGLLYLNIILFVYIQIVKSGYDMERRSALAEQQLSIQIEYYNNIKADQDKTRALWHDISKYMRSMRALVAESGESAAEACMSEVEDIFANIGNVVDVDNPVVSAILNHGMQRAHNQGISVVLDALVPQTLHISPLVLSTVIGNTFDNAIDACAAPAHTGTQEIEITLRHEMGLLFYKITNPFTASALTHKTSELHGYGLRNVQECVQSNGGTMLVSAEQNLFTVTVHLNDR